jgi:hypothetical protein
MLDLLELAPGSSRRRVIKLKPFQRNRSKFAGLSFGWPGKWGRRLASRSGIEFRPTSALGPSRILVAECFKGGSTGMSTISGSSVIRTRDRSGSRGRKTPWRVQPVREGQELGGKLLGGLEIGLMPGVDLAKRRIWNPVTEIASAGVTI